MRVQLLFWLVLRHPALSTRKHAKCVLFPSQKCELQVSPPCNPYQNYLQALMTVMSSNGAFPRHQWNLPSFLANPLPCAPHPLCTPEHSGVCLFA